MDAMGSRVCKTLRREFLELETAGRAGGNSYSHATGCDMYQESGVHKHITRDVLCDRWAEVWASPFLTARREERRRRRVHLSHIFQREKRLQFDDARFNLSVCVRVERLNYVLNLSPPELYSRAAVSAVPPERLFLPYMRNK